MKKILFAIVLFYNAINVNAQQNGKTLLASNDAKPIPQTITRELVTPSNLIFTKVINDIPHEEMTWCMEFSKKTNYINSINNQGKKYFPKVNKVFAKYNVPKELNVLLAMESSFNKDCVSSAGAVGYWQFMDLTATEYGLSIDSANDERKDFKKSTIAAARYLKAHYAMLRDWNLTVASYNCGIGNVRKAMAKSGKSNPSFFDIKPFLPKETQNYVMKYLALNILFKNYNLYTAQKIRWFSTSEYITETVINIEELMDQTRFEF
jgi:membrane-bound lytic murein transglycosylase MltF